jgi:hypothetical protein
MGGYYLSKRCEHSRGLRLDENIVPVEEIALSEIGNLTKLLGTYFSYKLDIFGDYNSDSGMIFFINDKKYNYADSSWAARIEKVGSQNRFIMTQNGAVVKDFTYTPEEILDWDPYSDEEDDLLTMVCNIKNNPERLQTLLETYQAEQTKQ